MLHLLPRTRPSMGAALSLALLTLSALPGAASAAPGGALGSADAIALGPDGAVVVADSRAGRLVAFQRPSIAAPEAKHFNLFGLDRTIAGQLGTTADRIRLTDIAFDRAARVAYVAVRSGFGAETTGAVFTATADGRVAPIDIAAAKPTEARLADVVADAVPLPRGRTLRDFTVTDLDFHGGALYVAGTSGTAFDAVLRRVPFPFGGSAAVSKLQIYHASHAQNETRAPIRAQTMVELGGVWHAVAAYTCTPLVLFPLDGLKHGARVVGKTIAELGYGNTPTDILAFSATDPKGVAGEYLLLLNRQRAPVMIPMPALAAAAKAPGLDKPAGFGKAGLSGMELPMVGFFAIADQGPERLVGLRRDPQTGTADLLSVRKNLFFRLTDFVGEFDMPGYTPPKGGDEMAGFRTMLQQEEGFRPRARR